jgi:hypothetical protein
MKKTLTLLIIIFISTLSYSQSNSLKVKLDSIIKEAELLYNYEKVAWNSTDLLMSKRKLKKQYGGYLIHHSNDTIFASFIDKKQKKRIARYSFTTTNLKTPFNSNFELKSLSETEKELLDIKNKILNQLSDKKYEVRFPNGFNPNLVLIKNSNEFKLYILMGTSESGVIPFGNDYLFRADSSGKIIKWRKFHSRLIPAQTEMPGIGKITSAIHSHLRTTPYITATDICTFRLYAEFTEIKSFKVYSPAIGKYMEYNLNNNLIEITE